MAIYKRQYINLKAYKNSFSSKKKGVFGSVVLEEKDKQATIKVKVSGLSLGDPHSFNAIFYDERQKAYVSINLGYIKMNKNQGQFKEVYEDGLRNNYMIKDAKAFYVEIESAYKSKNLIFLYGEADESYIFDGNFIKQDLEKKEVYKNTKFETSEIVQDKKYSQDENITKDFVELLEEKEVTESEELSKIIEIQQEEVYVEQVEEENIHELIESEVPPQNDELVESYEETEKNIEGSFDKSYNSENLDEEKRKTNKESKKRQGNSIDYFKILFGNDKSNGDNSALDIYEKLKEEVENLTKLANKSENEIAQENREKVILYNKDDNNNSIDDIFTAYPVAKPFDFQNFEVDWRTISLSDLGVLQKRYWKLFYDQTIVNAVEKYSEILLGRYYDEKGKEKHILAIKDEYTEDKVNKAIEAGAVQFKSIIKNERIVNGVIGFWLIKLSSKA